MRVGGHGSNSTPTPYFPMVTAAGVKTFFHPDKLGSIVALTDTSGNMVEGPFTYDAYGNCNASGQACATGEPYRFTGRRYDPETGLYYYRARYYSASLGRFLQTDPIGYKDDINWYAYVGNDPTDKTDPTGLQHYDSDGYQLDDTPVDTSRTLREWGNAALLASSVLPFIGAARVEIGIWKAVNESMPEASSAFQASQGGRAGMAYVVNGVKFDGVIGKSLMEAKANYGQFVGKNGAFKSWFANSATGGRGMVAQAERQLEAAKGRNIVWRVDGDKAAGAIRQLFKENGIKGIDVQVAKQIRTGSHIPTSSP